MCEEGANERSQTQNRITKHLRGKMPVNEKVSGIARGLAVLWDTGNARGPADPSICLHSEGRAPVGKMGAGGGGSKAASFHC